MTSNLGWNSLTAHKEDAKPLASTRVVGWGWELDSQEVLFEEDAAQWKSSKCRSSISEAAATAQGSGSVNILSLFDGVDTHGL